MIDEERRKVFIPMREETRLERIRSGRSIVLAMATKMSRLPGRLGHSKKLYKTVCCRFIKISNSSIITTLQGDGDRVNRILHDILTFTSWDLQDWRDVNMLAQCGQGLCQVTL